MARKRTRGHGPLRITRCAAFVLALRAKKKRKIAKKRKISGEEETTWRKPNGSRSVRNLFEPPFTPYCIPSVTLITLASASLLPLLYFSQWIQHGGTCPCFLADGEPYERHMRERDQLNNFHTHTHTTTIATPHASRRTGALGETEPVLGLPEKAADSNRG